MKLSGTWQPLCWILQVGATWLWQLSVMGILMESRRIGNNLYRFVLVKLIVDSLISFSGCGLFYTFMEFTDRGSYGDTRRWVSVYSEEDSIISGDCSSRNSYIYWHTSFKKKVKKVVMKSRAFLFILLSHHTKE